MDHTSPTALSGADGTRGPEQYLPLPEPVAVYRGLARRWTIHAPAPLRLPDDLIGDLITLAEHDVRTVTAQNGDGTRPGFLGKVVDVLAGPDRSARTRRTFTTLSRFAELCGVGWQTSHGFGAVTVHTR